MSPEPTGADVSGRPVPFAVTTTIDKLALPTDRRGNVTFQVTNLTGRPVRARIDAHPDDPTRAGWYLVQGPSEVPMALSATTQVTVNVVVPADAPAGTYQVLLRVAVEDDPEYLAEGQPVSVVVPAPLPPDKKPPWLLLGIIAAVLVLIAGGTTWYFLARPPVPQNLVPPTIDLSAPVVGDTLTADPGDWDPPDVQVAYSWQRCDPSGPTNCTPIAGETSEAYTTTVADAGRSVSVRVTGTNRRGGVAATSAPVMVKPAKPQLPVHSQGTAVLKGTWTFDFDQGTLGSAGADVWWNQANTVNRYLVPRSGAGIARLGPVDYTTLPLETLTGAAYSGTPIDGSNNASNQLAPGTVIAVRTDQGRYAKVLITSYGYDLAITWTTYG